MPSRPNFGAHTSPKDLFKTTFWTPHQPPGPFKTLFWSPKYCVPSLTGFITQLKERGRRNCVSTLNIYSAAQPVQTQRFTFGKRRKEAQWHAARFPALATFRILAARSDATGVAGHPPRGKGCYFEDMVATTSPRHGLQTSSNHALSPDREKEKATMNLLVRVVILVIISTARRLCLKIKSTETERRKDFYNFSQDMKALPAK